MSSALALAGVTAVLRDLLNDRLINHDISGALGGGVTVSVLPPDRVVSGTEASQLNLFLHQVTANSGWRNEALPSMDGSGRQRLTNPPLALDLHYLLSAYSSDDLHAEILLGYAMQLLHEHPVLTRTDLRTALTPSPVQGSTLPPALRALARSGLEQQIELIKITPEFLSTEEMTKLWSATLSNFRPTAAYKASVVLIEATTPVGTPLPVLTRGKVEQGSTRDRGVVVEAGLQPAVPTLEAITPTGGNPVALIGELIQLTGHHLEGAERTVVLSNDRFEIDEATILAEEPEDAAIGCELIQFRIDEADSAEFPVGIYRVGARMLQPRQSEPQRTNSLALTLAPEITRLPQNPVARDGSGTLRFSISFQPEVREGQEVVLLLGERAVAPQPFTPPTLLLYFEIVKAEPSPSAGHLVRLRIDGIESPVINRKAKPPTFLDKRLVVT